MLKYSWDPESGYFGYVVVNDAKTEILRTEKGINYNMGLGGVYPLIAGIANEKQKAAMLDHLRSPTQLWTPIGLTAVDQSAPYYRPDGYWNGSVWMPHQWFFWKAMFDLGDSKMAYRIAKTAVDLWKKEVDTSYNCFEHFLIDTGRGAGWHQFGGLSGPVTHWFSALYTPGTVTVGYDTWIEAKETSGNDISLKLKFYEPSNKNLIWICMDEADTYCVEIDGVSHPYKLLHPGLLELEVKDRIKGCLLIRMPEPNFISMPGDDDYIPFIKGAKCMSGGAESEANIPMKISALQ